MTFPAGLADPASIPASSRSRLNPTIVIGAPVMLTVLGLLTESAFSASNTNPETGLASLRAYNPTAWDGPVVLEIPIGRIASPGILDWENVRLVRDGREIPFAIREGTPHWKANLVAPVKEPRAEDLLVFSTVLPPATWAGKSWPVLENDWPIWSEQLPTSRTPNGSPM